MRHLALCLALTGAACVKAVPSGALIEPDALLLKLPPQALGVELHLAQRVTVRHGDKTWAFDAQLEAEPAEVRLAAFALGQTVAHLSWNGVKFEETHSTHVPAVVTPARILSDVQLAFWPEESVRAALPSGFAVSTTGLVRTVSRDGQPFAEVRYSGAGPAWPTVELRQLVYGYTLLVESRDNNG